MKVFEIEEFFTPLKDNPCPITEKLIKGGYQQKSGGYIDHAHSKHVVVDYKKAMPSQSWHLLECYCPQSKKKDNFTKQIQCGELLFWMAEVSESVSESDLDELANNVLREPNNRRRGNKLIQDICFEKIMEKVKKKQDNDIKDGAFSSMYSVAAFIISFVSIICDLFFKELTSAIILIAALVISLPICMYYEKTIIKGVATESNKILQACQHLNVLSRKIGYLSYVLLALSYIFKLIRIEIGVNLLTYLIDKLF